MLVKFSRVYNDYTHSSKDSYTQPEITTIPVSFIVVKETVWPINPLTFICGQLLVQVYLHTDVTPHISLLINILMQLVSCGYTTTILDFLPQN